MLDSPNGRPGNVLLGSIAADESRKISERSESVTLPLRYLVSRPETPITHVYFPVTCVISVLSVMSDGAAVETAVIGCEGMAPLMAFHGVRSAPDRAIVQVGGEAIRIPIDDFDELLAECPDLHRALHRFSQALFTFAVQTSGCNRRHSVVQRCARWLLVTHDRIIGDEFPLTHLFLSQMLGVRRSSVTIAAEALRAAGAVVYTRGNVRIADRALLESSACECYEIVRATYQRLLEASSMLTATEKS